MTQAQRGWTVTMGFYLEAALQRGGTVRVPVGRHVGAARISKPVVLEGEPGSVLDGGDSGLILDIEAQGEVTLRGLELSNGHGSSGGLVRHGAGRLVIDRCTFSHGAAKANGGGALYSEGDSLEVRATAFLDNLARQGGAVLLDQEVDALFVDCLFARNAAVQGGALRLREAAQARLVGCTLANNRCPPNPEVKHLPAGAAFYLSGTTSRRPKLTMQNCLVAAFPGEAFVEGFNDPEVPGTVTLSHSLITSRLQSLADATCRAADAGFVGETFFPSASGPAASLADAALYEKVRSTTLEGQPRNGTVGAFNAK